jgi:Fur family ferric uptake transcriptional regulator
MSHQELDLASTLHHQGHRMTAQRQMVLDAVCEIGGHARPEQVYELVQQKSPAVHRATVYRTLKLLCELGLVTDTLTAEGYLVYEIAGGQPHHHLVCRCCGADVEFSDEAYRAFVEALQSNTGFQVEATHITLSGVCPACQE